MMSNGKGSLSVFADVAISCGAGIVAAAEAGGIDAGTVVVFGCAAATPLGRCTCHARNWLYHLPLYSRAFMSKDTVSSSPTSMWHAAIRSSPNTSNAIHRGRASMVSMRYSMTLHGFPVLAETPLFSLRTAMIFPEISIFVL